jgi:hypothetical protein
MRTLAALALIGASLQADAAPPSKSNQLVPFDLVVQGAREKFAIHGTVHVMTDVTGASVKVHTNFLNTASIGLTTGLTSPVNGSQSSSLVDELDGFGDGDITMLIALVMRETYLGNQEDLKSYAAKVKYYNQLKLRFKAGLLIDAQVELFPPPCNDDDDNGSD